MKTCETCKHWTKPEDRDDFYTVVTFAGDDWDMEKDDYKYAGEADKILGLCETIQMGDDLSTQEPLPLAVTMDGSRYRADLFTQKDFGCVLNEDKPDG